jgi:hypothetical protein
MSTAPALEADDIGPIEWVNELTFIARSGGNRDLEEGDSVLVEVNGEDLEVEVTRIVGNKTVFERVSSGLGHYGKSSVGEILRTR